MMDVEPVKLAASFNRLKPPAIFRSRELSPAERLDDPAHLRPDSVR
jgi:hypothetical protein